MFFPGWYYLLNLEIKRRQESTFQVEFADAVNSLGGQCEVVYGIDYRTIGSLFYSSLRGEGYLDLKEQFRLINYSFDTQEAMIKLYAAKMHFSDYSLNTPEEVIAVLMNRDDPLYEDLYIFLF